MKKTGGKFEKGECDSPVRWMMRYGRGESHSPKNCWMIMGANRIRPKNNGIAIQNRNNAQQYIGEFGVIEKI